MRFLTRINTVVFLAIGVVVYLGWVLPSLHIDARAQKAWSGRQRRLVVFGDSWSDTGEYRMKVPENAVERNFTRPLWTETLCKHLVCDYIDNFARSAVSWRGQRGAFMPDSLVHTELVVNVTNQNPNNPKFLPDFAKQVQQWINFEKQKGLDPKRSNKQEWTIFTVFFGISDIWQYADADEKEASWAVKESIDTMFAQLDLLAEYTRGPIHVVLSKLVDITFFPEFQAQPVGPFPGHQRTAVWLQQQWNLRLEQAAGKWTKGFIHLLDMDKWLVERIKEEQVYASGMSTEDGSGGKTVAKPKFCNVRAPFTPLPGPAPEYPFDMSDNKNNGTRDCKDASQYLFWDGMHLSGRAHELIGIEAAGLVSHNTTFNLHALNIAAEEAAAAKDGGAQKDEDGDGAKKEEARSTFQQDTQNARERRMTVF
ncbi:hypothetical protein K490DRAFT_54277 [Saccharata proteae CBS 121410]|uniref:Uncharacterized protein n=1 Tax=Saccharata proteae CBS 121410 TaxID=1314787 RepID=A0A9P4I085_9PEZI|nr:hypothetical protein K490DRAFT_54277 [Saccharata proteae CBS 121410]